MIDSSTTIASKVPGDEGKATAGPWTAARCGVFAGRNCIAVTDTDNAPISRMEANARLMAAAPDMLQALRDAERALRDGGTFPIKGITWELVATAIAKAEGR